LQIEEEVERFIVDEIAAGSGMESVPRDCDLVAARIIDSLGITELISFLERRFGIAVDDDDIDLENFKSIESIAAFAERKGARAA
jgi:acyl carrier protein